MCGIGTLVKTSLVDFPGRIAAAVFLKGCNLRCPYCYNAELATGSIDGSQAVTFEEITAHLKKRKNVLSGFVLSGGEALLSPYFHALVKTARSFGYAIKLDTNGTMPDMLTEILENPELCPDFISLDVKTSPERYIELSAAGSLDEISRMYQQSIKRSIKLISALPADKREFRTVLVPGLVGEREIREIASLLPEDASWMFAPFKNKNCLDVNYTAIQPYPEDAAKNLVHLAKSIISGAVLR